MTLMAARNIIPSRKLPPVAPAPLFTMESWYVPHTSGINLVPSHYISDVIMVFYSEYVCPHVNPEDRGIDQPKSLVA